MLVSIASWAAIFRKLFALKRVKARNEAFEREFWSGASLNDLFNTASRNALANRRTRWNAFLPAACASSRSCASGALRDAGTLMDGARRAMRASFQREMDAVESNLSFPGLGRLGVALCGPVRHRLGHHARLHRPGRRCSR